VLDVRDVLDVTETAALAARKASDGGYIHPGDSSFARPRPVINAASSDRPRHRGPLFSVFAPLFKGMH